MNCVQKITLVAAPIYVPRAVSYRSGIWSTWQADEQIPQHPKTSSLLKTWRAAIRCFWKQKSENVITNHQSE